MLLYIELAIAITICRELKVACKLGSYIAIAS